jgi:HJR/Mrr/RecB family endonuclease
MNWIKNNIWNIVGAFGTIATLTFGLVGLLVVPEYINDIKKQKQLTANFELITDIQELIYSNQKINSNLIITLIKGKEIKYGIDFPYSPDSLLIEVQESFISFKPIPINSRKVLYDKTDSIRTSIANTRITKNENIKKETSSLWENLLFSFSLILIALSIGIFFGLLTKRKQEVEKKVEEKINEIEQTSTSTLIDYRRFEILVASALKKFNFEIIDYTFKPQDYGFDFLVKDKGIAIAIEVKTSLNTGSLNAIKQAFDKYKPDVLIIVSNIVQKLPSFNILKELRNRGRKIYFIAGLDIETIYTELDKVFKIEFNTP